MTRRFVQLLDAAEGIFDGTTIRADELPTPMSSETAPTLDALVSSYQQEIFDWGAAGESESNSGPDSPGIIKYDPARAQEWVIRLFGKIDSDGDPLPLFGFTVKPRLSYLRLHLWTFLLLDRSLRALPWQIVHKQTGEILNWRSEEVVSEGDYNLVLEDPPMIIKYATSRLHFPPTRAFGDEDSSRATGTSASVSGSCVSGVGSKRSGANRGSMPKRQVRERDQRCLVSGDPISGPESNSLLGRAKVAHILPFAQDLVADALRFVFDPTPFASGGVKPTEWRERAVNSGGNLMMLRAQIKKQFDALRIAVDPFTSAHAHPTVVNLAGHGQALLYDRHFNLMVDPTFPFPVLPSDTASIQGPAPACLLAHLIAALSWSCRHRMTHERTTEVKLARTSESDESDRSLDDYILQWQHDIDIDSEDRPEPEPELSYG